MRMTNYLIAGVLIVFLCLPSTIRAQYGAKNGEWTAFGGDGGSTRYSPLDQITRDNVKNLQPAWTFKTDNFTAIPVPQSEVTPLMVKGVLYLTVGPRRNVVAVDAGTGEALWIYRPDEGARSD